MEGHRSLPITVKAIALSRTSKRIAHARCGAEPVGRYSRLAVRVEIPWAAAKSANRNRPGGATGLRRAGVTDMTDTADMAEIVRVKSNTLSLPSHVSRLPTP
jgi:hypothetical protein